MKIRIKKDKILLFTSQLNSLIKAGISVTQALDILILSETDKNFSKILEKIKRNLDYGKSIFDSFKTFENIFGNHFLYMLKIGELSGSLNNSLENIHNYLEYNLKNKRKVTSILIYPTIVFTISLIIFIFLLIFILPNFIALFEENQIPLPSTTKFLIFLSDNFSYVLISVLFIFCSILLSIKHINSKTYLKQKKDKLLLNFFILGHIMKLYYADEVYYSLYILLNSGINLIEGFDIIIENISNLEIKRKLLNTQRGIRAGYNISNSLKYLDLFNNRFQSFIRSGEESGFLTETFLEISKILKLEYEYKLKEYIAFIGPISIVLLGIFIIFIIFSVYLPIFSILDIF